MLSKIKRILIIVSLCVIPNSFALAVTPSVTIQSLTPAGAVYSGNAVYFTAVAENFNGSVSFSLSDSKSGSISNSNINSSGVFGWVPSSSDAGTHTITVTATDGSGNSANAYQTITVIGPATISIQNLYPGSSVNVGQTVFFGTTVTGLSNPSYSVSDSVVSSMTSSNINASGGFSWTPKTQDVGSHTITVTATDGGRSASVSQGISVAIATATISSITPGTSITLRQTLSFTVTPTGFTNPTYSVNDSFPGSGISNGNINPSGFFNWTPNGTNNIGDHLITILVSDSSGNSATVSQKITVGASSVNVSSISPSQNINAGTPFSFKINTSGFTNPVFTVSDSFSGSSVTNNNASSTLSSFNWTPTILDRGTHYLTIYASDSTGNTATTNLTVIVNSSPTTNSSPTQPNTTSSPTKYIFNNYLGFGSSGTDVTELQKILIQKGYLTGQATGYFGNLTANALKMFQSANGLSQTGTLGPGTRSALNGGTSSNTNTQTKYVFTKPLTLGSSGSEVTELQNKLTALGLYSGPITGTFGPLTQSAVKKFQAKYGLDQLGNVGPGTRSMLNSL